MKLLQRTTAHVDSGSTALNKTTNKLIVRN